MANHLKDILAEDFQITVESTLERNKNLLDILSKSQVACSRLSRAITKAMTQCGCVDIEPLSDKNQLNHGISGSLCKNCRETVEKEMGNMLFYTAAICNALNLSIYDVMLKEKQTLSLLRNFNLK